MTITTSIYDLMIKSALVFNILFILLNYKKYNLKLKDAILIIILENIFIVIGGKVFTYLDEFPKYSITDIPGLWFTSYGNMLGALVGLVVYALIFKHKLADLFGLGAVPLPLVYAIGKIGCFSAGCCYGINYDGFGKVIYLSSNQAPLNTGLFPIQLVEAIIFTIIFIIFYKKSRHEFKMQDFAYLLMSISIAKFFLDYLRAGRENILFSFNQRVSIILFTFGLFILSRIFIKNKELKTKK